MAPAEGESGSSRHRRRQVRFGRKPDEEEDEERRRLTGSSTAAAAPDEHTLNSSDFNHLYEFKGAKYLARTFTRPTGDNLIFYFLFACLGLCLFLLYCVLFHFGWFHFHVARAYASLGHAHAQHVVGERLLHGAGVTMDREEAMRWFRMASDAGHPHASYNLAVGHLTGEVTDVEPGEVHRLIKHAHDNGVAEASDVWHNACKNGHCED